MSNFYCDKCGAPCFDSDTGYTTGCKHYPSDKKIEDTCSLKADVTCPKCRSQDITIRWHKTNYAALDEKVCGKYDETQMTDEHLHYYCVICYFDWASKL